MKEKQFEKWMAELIRQLQTILLLQHFAPVTIKKNFEMSPSAECKLHYPYKTITITYGKDLFDSWLNGDLERATSIVVHEMCHPITDELYCKAYERFSSKNEIEDARESLTDHICNIVLTNKLLSTSRN